MSYAGMLLLKAFMTFRKYFVSPFWFILMSMRQIPLRLLNFCVMISFRFNKHHLLSASQDCMWSQNSKYLGTCTSTSGGGEASETLCDSQICLSQILYFLLYLLPRRVSVTCQIKKMEQPIHSKPDKYTRSPLHHERLVEDVHSGVSSRAQNTVLNRCPAPWCCSEAIVQLPISAAGCWRECRISVHNCRTGSFVSTARIMSCFITLR